MIQFPVTADYTEQPSGDTLTARVLFTPVLSARDFAVLVTGQAPQQGFNGSITPGSITAGVLGPMMGGGSVQLIANAGLGLHDPLQYRADFHDAQYNGEPVTIASVTFVAPTDTSGIDLGALTVLPSIPSSTSPTDVRNTIVATLDSVGLITIVVDEDGSTITFSTSATRNQADAYLLNRNNHSGQQTADTISDFNDAADARVQAGALQLEQVEAKGDLLIGSGAGTVGRLSAIGSSDGQVMTRSSSSALGMAWADPASTGGSGTITPNPYIGLVGDGVNRTLTVTHNLNTMYVGVIVFRTGSPDEDIDVRPERTDPNTITFNNDEVWGAGQYTVMVFWIGQSDTTAPNAGTFAYSSSDTTSITYTYSGQSDDESGVASIDAYDSGGTLLQSGLTGGTYTRSGLSPLTPYGTYLKVTDNDGNSSVTATVTHTTDAAAGDTTPPTPGTAAFVSATTSSITYSFGPGSDANGVTEIDAYDAGGTLLNANVTSPWTRSGLNPNSNYSTFFRYRDAAGNVADSNTVTDPTQALPVGQIISSHAEKTSSSLSTMPTHQQGDLLIMFAYRDGFNTPPSVPSGWTISSPAAPTGTTSNVCTVGSKIAQNSSEVSGTWTNCTNLACIVVRGFAGGIGAVAFAEGTGTTITIPALTLQRNDGSSWVLAHAGDRSGAQSLTTPPAGMNFDTGYNGSSTEQDTGVYDSGGGVTSFAGGTIAYATSAGWCTVALELKAA